MARFILANRRAGMFLKSQKADARRAADSSFGLLFARSAAVLMDSQPEDLTARRVVVFEADAAEAEAKRRQLPPDVLLEEAIPHYVQKLRAPTDLIPAPPPSYTAALPARADGMPVPARAPMPAGTGLTLGVRVTGGGQPLEGAEVILYLRGFGGSTTDQKQITDRSGSVSFAYSSFWSPAALVALPAGGFWSWVVRGPGAQVTVDIPALPADGPLAWWHRAMGITAFDENRGRGIKVGVIDTGVGPHPCLGHVTSVGAFIGGQPIPDGGADVDSHGSHVCGIIGARPVSAGQYGGVAPGADLYCARVFASPDGGADQGDIVLAIDELSRNRGVDLINMSLGATAPSQIERDAIQDALERGTLCVCAAGNSNGPVEYPGRFPETVAVSALGLAGWGPPGSLASTRLPDDSARHGPDNLYLANFSCTGPEVACCAPGVGIISTVPSRFGLVAPYAAMDGTSMASPAACGLLATLLAAAAGSYTRLPRDRSRAETARRILANACRDLGMDANFQGRGLPQAAAAVPAATGGELPASTPSRLLPEAPNSDSPGAGAPADEARPRSPREATPKPETAGVGRRAKNPRGKPGRARK